MSSSYILSPRLAARDDKQKDMTLAPKNAPSPLEKTDKKIQGPTVVCCGKGVQSKHVGRFVEEKCEWSRNKLRI